LLLRQEYKRWRTKVTVGIAGLCQHEGKPAIVLCADWQGTYGTMLKSEDLHKIRSAGKAVILIADDPSAADELVSRLTPVFEQFDQLEKDSANFDLRITQLMADIRTQVRFQHNDRTEHMLSMNYNMTVAEFNRDGRNSFPLDLYYDIRKQIAALGIGCDLICAYVNDVEPMLLEITSDGSVKWLDSYVCIGSGAWLAMAFLVQSSWNDFSDLGICLSKIYFARMAARRDPAVGDYSSILIITPDAQLEMTDKGWDFVKENTPTISFPDKLNFKKSFLKKV
jgi:20S proteasome alpha/beta subunit